MYDFLEYYPDCTVFVRGNTASRTRLYRMGISNNIELFLNNIHIFGYNNGNWHIFQEGVNYDAFIATKILNFSVMKREDLNNVYNKTNKPGITIDDTIKSSTEESSLFLKRKMDQARAFLDKHGLPEGMGEWKKTENSK